jgi:hypothetical protein
MWRCVSWVSKNSVLTFDSALGDCWFINGLCIMGTQPKYVRQLFVSIPKYPEKLGKYEIRFFNLGIWQTVVIDDQLPCSTHNQLAFAKCKNENEFWIPLLQKAFAVYFNFFIKISIYQNRN